MLGRMGRAFARLGITGLKHGSTAGGGGGPGTVFAFDNSSTGNFGSGTSFGFNLTNNVAANALCVVSVVTGGGNFITSITDTAGSYTKVTGSPNGATMEFWYAFRAASQSAGATITINQNSASTMDVVFASFTGGSGANVDTGGTYVNGASPAWTTTATNTLLVGAIGPNNGNLTATAPWVGISFASAFNTLVYKIVSSPQSSVPLVETGSGGYFGAVVTAFK